MVANIFAHRHTLDPGGGVKSNRAQSTMKANMLSLQTPMTPGMGSKGIFFLF